MFLQFFRQQNLLAVSRTWLRTTAPAVSARTFSVEAPESGETVAAKPTRARFTAEQKANLPPKRPSSAYFSFLQKTRAEANLPNTLEAHANHSRTASAKWKLMSQEEKDSYAPSPEVVAKYREAFNEWSRNIDRKMLKSLNDVRKARGLRNRFLGEKQTARYASPFAYFYSDWARQYPNVEGGPAKERLKKAHVAWANLSEEEKNVFVKIQQEKKAEQPTSESP